MLMNLHPPSTSLVVPLLWADSHGKGFICFVRCTGVRPCGFVHSACDVDGPADSFSPAAAVLVPYSNTLGSRCFSPDC